MASGEQIASVTAQKDGVTALCFARPMVVALQPQDLAIQDNYQLSLHDFLYGRNNAIQYPKGLAQIGETVKFYFDRFGIPFSQQAPPGSG